MKPLGSSYIHTYTRFTLFPTDVGSLSRSSPIKVALVGLHEAPGVYNSFPPFQGNVGYFPVSSYCKGILTCHIDNTE